jgi:hypothetical protein
MAQHATSKLENIKISVEKFLYDNLITTESLFVDWEGVPFESGASPVTKWIQPRLISFLDPTWKPKATASTRGNVASCILNVNIFVKRDFADSADEHYELRDTVAKYVFSGVSIPLRDYASGTTRPWVTLIDVDDITTDTAIPNPDHWQYNYSVSLSWQREWDWSG